MSTLATVIEVIAAALGRPASSIDPRTSLAALAGDDRTLWRILEACERQRGGRLLPAGRFSPLTTPEALAAAIDAPPAATVAPLGGGTFPISAAQEFVWLRLRHPAGGVPPTARALRLTGDLDVSALRQAVAALPARHGALRLSVNDSGSEARQSVAAERPLELKVSALPGAGQPRADREQAAIAAEVSAPFELGRGPLIRVTLFEDGTERLLVAVAHALVADRWSMQVLFDDLAALYARSAPPTAAQFSEFTAWERVSSERDDAHGDFWRKKLAGAPGVLEVPTDRWRAANATFQRAAVPVALPGADGVDAGAALGGVMHRYAGESQLLFGTLLPARHTLGAERIVGAFELPAILSLAVTDELSFDDLRARFQGAVEQARSHARINARSFAEAIAGTNSPGQFRPPQVRLTVEDAYLPWQLANVTATELPLPWRVDPESLSLQLRAEAGGLSGHLVYDPGMVREEAARRLVEHWTELLQSGRSHPGRALRRLALVGSAEVRRLMALNPAPHSAAPACVHQLFEAQAERTPDAVALAHGQTSWSYRQLEARANQLAHWLVRQGVGPEKRVVLALRPGTDAIAALYATLKAGGAYVPLDPDGPPDRLFALAKDAGATVVLVESALVAPFAETGLKVVAIEDCNRALASEPTTRPAVAVHPENLAYIIYTSGSTGEPKGVAVPHSSVVNHNLAVARRFGLRPGDRVLQFTPINFDAAGEEIYPPLLAGATCVIRTELAPVHGFRDLIEREQLTVLSLPPAYLQEWVRELEHRHQQVPGSLRLVLLGGEKLLPESLATWGRVGGARIPWFNVYGPTEATVTSALCELGEGALALSTPTLPIGGAVDNARLYLLDPNLELVPFGHSGELFIAGAGVSRGYLGRADQTAERFLPDPFSSSPGARMYRTGDVARHLPDGRLEFVGRVDHQVKIRGFRVELGEVEAALRRQPGVADAVALAREDAPGGTRLIAYLVPAAEATVDPTAIRGALRQALPDYMVPSAFVTVPVFPLTPNGKVDRKALPVPTAEQFAAASSSRELDELEEAIANIWQAVLGVPKVGAEDNFFDLGGQSLSAMQVLSRVSETIGVELQVQDVFEAPTVAGLADRVKAIQGPDVGAMSDAQVDAMLAELLAKQGQPGSTEN